MHELQTAEAQTKYRIMKHQKTAVAVAATTTFFTCSCCVTTKFHYSIFAWIMLK